MILRATALCLSLALALPALAAKGNVAAGKKKAASCAACHGDGNQTVNDTFPKLAGQYPEYLAKSLQRVQVGQAQERRSWAQWPRR